MIGKEMVLAICCISRIGRNEIFGNKNFYLDILYKLFFDSVMIYRKSALK